jgi:hypothetical protein
MRPSPNGPLSTVEGASRFPETAVCLRLATIRRLALLEVSCLAHSRLGDVSCRNMGTVAPPRVAPSEPDRWQSPHSTFQRPGNAHSSMKTGAPQRLQLKRCPRIQGKSAAAVPTDASSKRLEEFPLTGVRLVGFFRYHPTERKQLSWPRQ